ncbi:DeoR family transcriptional regulator [Acrocarpospora pleiomorpha]|uniref:Lactose phosphotransferase system repressor n=1 Tax=Acrocarpospora pleiomorpha TaxID=90975 RepID=A0A5M3XZT7_9ACTN|nr:DeoR/GlpR family DNA-binding transcription regulator [Acrocarpospora pleiomorpha]GES23898.1 DeoR family transcriptional regulator [Acrocarpospora pleiomorpha]
MVEMSGPYVDQSARLTWIQEQLVEHGHVTVSHVAHALRVSRMTVHRDFDVLHERGVLRKVRGGATAARSSSFESEASYREGAARIQKHAIAKAAAGLVAPGNVILLDESTTALGLVQRLKPTDAVTVVTNFQLAIDQLIAKPEIRLITVGGDYQPRYRATMGTLAERFLADVHADILFASCTGLHNGDLYHQDQQIVAIKRRMLASATTRVLLLDSSKLGQVALYRVCSVSEFTHVVVDDAVSARDIAALRDAGLTVHVAKTVIPNEL